jgi:hypothetical protein
MGEQLVALVIQELPNIVTFVKSLAQKVPSDSPVTDADVIAALQQAISSSLAKDDQWLASHPEGPVAPAEATPPEPPSTDV